MKKAKPSEAEGPKKTLNRIGLYSGEFAALYGISKDTLRYYDKIGVFQPQLRGENGYRLYSLDQTRQFDLIMMLRSVKLPLEEIAQCLQVNEPQKTIALLRRQAAVVERQLESLEKLKQRMMETAEMIEYGLKAEYGVLRLENREEARFLAFETTPELIADRYRRIAFIRQNLQNDPVDAQRLDFLLRRILRKEHLESRRFTFTEDYFCIRVDRDTEGPHIVVQPPGLYAAMEYQGSYDGLKDVYERLLQEIQQRGYRIAGDAYETELLGYAASRSGERYVIQLAVLVEEESPE